MNRTTRVIGFWSGIICVLLAIAFTLLMILDVMHIWGGTLQLMPVLLLAPAYLILLSCIYDTAAADKKIWALLGLVLSVPYAVLTSFNYMMQLTIVHQNPALYTWLAMAYRPDSMFGAVEALGYTWQCLGLLVLVPLFNGEPVLKALLLIDGFLAVVAFAFDLATANPLHPSVIISLGVWCFLFPASTVMMGNWLRASG